MNVLTKLQFTKLSFMNGWYCKRCHKITEHSPDGFCCVKCGLPLAPTRLPRYGKATKKYVVDERKRLELLGRIEEVNIT